MGGSEFLRRGRVRVFEAWEGLSFSGSTFQDMLLIDQRTV